MAIREIDKELLAACSALDEKRVETALLSGADPNCLDDYHDYPLLACLDADRYEKVYTSSKNINDSDDEDDDKGNLILDSIYEEYIRETDFHRIRIFDLLIAYGADLNSNLRDGESILWNAVHKSPRIVEYLLKKGANPNHAQVGTIASTVLGHAWIDEAIHHDCKTIVEQMSSISRVLLSYGALPYAWEEIDAKTVDLSTIRSFEDVPPFIHPEIPENIRSLSEEDKRLFVACNKVDIDTALIALDMGANVNAQNADDDFATPLYVVCKVIAFSELSNERIDAAYRMVSLLLSRGANPNLHTLFRSHINGKETLEGETPLMLVAWLAKNVEISTLLLEHGANPNFASTSPNDVEETVMDLNCFDYNVDDPLEVKPIEMLLMRFGGCKSFIFNSNYCRGMREVDAALVFSCQRMAYHSVQVAVKLGGDLSILDAHGRSLPVIVLQDVPQLCGRRFAKEGWNLEDSITDFLLFLLVGLNVPTTQESRNQILSACINDGYEQTLQVLINHHILGKQFQKCSVLQDDA